jgi:DNA ligase-associated metallophosphoesterase
MNTIANVPYKTCEAEIAGEHLLLHPMKAIWWEKEQALLMADLHLGKQGHFRREGIALPEAVGEKNWQHLRYLIENYQPKRVIFMGDLFHSDMTQEWGDLEMLVNLFPNITFELIIGNHDLMPEFIYKQAGMQIHKETLLMPPFLLSHHPLKKFDEKYYNLAGHIHPGVLLGGKGHQYLRMPCFFFGTNCGILPAFGQFTGVYVLTPKKTDKVYVVVKDEVICAG